VPEKHESPGVSTIVVSFNTREKTRACLAALGTESEIILVDNASADGSPEMVAQEFPHVKLIRNSENRGFGPANNQGIDAASRELLLFLNSDAYAHPGALRTLASAFADSSVVAAGGRLLNPDGSLQQSTAGRLTLWAVFCEQTLLEKAFPGSPLASPYWNTSRLMQEGGEPETEQVMGAALMCRAGLERFDERFFLYCEDTDLCLRLRRHGRIVYVPDAAFTHDLGSSSSANRWKAIARYNRGKELYFQIHGGIPAMAICWLFDRLGALLRLAAWLLLCVATLFSVKRYRDQALLFSRVLVAPLSGPKRS
jgi:GT2 family glycosyltransferase